jgi:hypothetical protein
VFCGTGYNFFSAVHAATEHQFECGDEFTGDLRNGLEAALIDCGSFGLFAEN